MKYDKPRKKPYENVRVKISPDAPPLYLSEKTKRDITRLLALERRSDLVDWPLGVPPER